MKMDRITAEKLKVSLTDAIDAWFEKAGEKHQLPWVGDNVASHMADAALAVLLGIADAQRYLESEGMLTDGGASSPGYDE